MRTPKTEKERDEEHYRKKRRIFSLVSLILFAVVMVLLTLLFVCVLAPYLHSTEELRAFLKQYGFRGRFILLGLQCLQVIVAFIPGEIVELGAGYAYGALEGTLLCLAGVAISSSAIFLLTKKLGVKLVEMFIPREKIDRLRFINSEKKLRRTIFLLFFIPGTPKDVLTYFVGLTKITLSEFLAITLVARIPSVVSSTICGHMVGKEDYKTALIVYAITAVVSGLGYLLYNKLLDRHHDKKAAKKADDMPEETTADLPQSTDEIDAPVPPVDVDTDTQTETQKNDDGEQPV